MSLKGAIVSLKAATFSIKGATVSLRTLTFTLKGSTAAILILQPHQQLETT
ncbi:MAG: hypothetical protein RMY36_002825 [Nostoc sp. SerVER01]|nr:hypothetical protein [Nostoc sp. SerVER01]MDZ8024153.1 hypothetical protein [Nostoc sp. DedQUE11]MDZ8074444.1 hypothetical protein [Nostoc sp. DedQUE01]MDZ8077758.1 hypothetical protein [Nostoc sp. DcaGUA01]MDZ8240375.1 hypothetical protein [Nostoc sp. ChiQUE01a]